MQDKEELYKQLEQLEEILEILYDERTARKYVEPYEIRLQQVKNAIQMANVPHK